MRRVVSLTPAGHELGRKIVGHLPDCTLWHRPNPFRARVQQAFRDGDALVMICAAGIVVRSLAPVLGSKKTDPPVVVLDQDGMYVVALLSGHEGGANALAVEVAEAIGARPVLTTANPYLEPVYAAGMGCERDCSDRELETLLNQCLQLAGITNDRLHSVNSIDVKRDEPGLQKLCGRLDVPFRVYSADDLSPMEPLLSVRSDYVKETVGVYGVAESAALLAAAQAVGAQPELLVPKRKSGHATCAIARAYSRTAPDPPGHD